jgi:hypothetical protein
MTLRIFCERCNKDVTGEDYVIVQLHVNLDRAMREHRRRYPAEWHFCTGCAEDQLRLDLGPQE